MDSLESEIDAALLLSPKESLRRLLELQKQRSFSTRSLKEKFAGALIATGLEAAAPHIRSLRESNNCSNWTLIKGSTMALRRGELDEGFKSFTCSLLFECIEQFHKAGQWQDIKGLFNVILALDKGLNGQTLRKPELLDPAYEHFSSLVEAFTKTGLDLDDHQIIAWLTGQNLSQTTWKISRTRIALAMALARHDKPAAENILEAMMVRWGFDYEIEGCETLGSEQAADMLLKWRGLPHPGDLNERYLEDGRESLSSIEWTAWLVGHYDWCLHVGLEQIDVEDCEMFPEMIEALRTVGAPEEAMRLKYLADQFWPDGKVPNVVKPVCEFIGQLEEDWDEWQEGLRKIFPKRNNTDLLLRKFILDHEHEFRQGQG